MRSTPTNPDNTSNLSGYAEAYDSGRFFVVFEQTCAGRCNASSRRKQEQYDRDLATWQAAMQDWTARRAHGEDAGDAPEKPRERDIVWTAGTPLWCLSDAAAIRAALTDLDDIVPVRLRHADGLQSTGAAEPVGGSKERPSPSSAMDDLAELVDWLRSWETAYRTSQGWPTAPYRGHSIDALTRSTAWHLGHLDGMLAHPAFTADDAGEDLGAVAYGLGVLHLHAKWEASAKTREKARWIAREMRCPQCHAKTLAQMEGEEKIECRKPDCGQDRGGPLLLTLDEYLYRVGEATAEAKAAAKLAKAGANNFDGLEGASGAA